MIVSTNAPNDVLGYYTLSSRELRLADLPPELKKKAGPYQSVPVTLIGRMAVTSSEQGKGVGELLLIDALKRSLRVTQDVASFAVFVEAKDNKAADFYERYEFIRLPNEHLKLFLPMDTIRKLP